MMVSSIPGFDSHLLGNACSSFLCGLQDELWITVHLGHRCAGRDTALFYPAGEPGRKITIGKRICELTSLYLMIS